MANFRRGKKAAEAAAMSSTGGKSFTPVHRWQNNGDQHFLQFLTSADEVLTVLYHNFIIVGQTKDGNNIYRDFISPTDPAFDGADGYDPLIERFGVKPKEYNVALAVALDPITKGGKVVDFEVQYREYEDKDGNTHRVPNVALVMQSVYASLFPYLFNFANISGPIEDRVLQITQSGKGKDKKLMVFDAGEAIELDDEVLEAFDYETHLESLASPERYEEYISPLPDDAEVVRVFGKKETSTRGSSTNKNSGSKSTARSTRPKATSSASSGSEDTPTQSPRFSRLKQKVESN